ncbi:EAL domain-containing protein [Vibrio parahaemolyticus]|nr:EAL domain-containing protein [Vibrio parahaemolyticus]
MSFEKKLHKLRFIYFLLFIIVLPLVLSLCFMFIKYKLNDLGRSYVDKIEAVISNVQDETFIATQNAETCKDVGSDLIFSNDMRELIVVKDKKAICSSKRGAINDDFSIDRREGAKGYSLIFYDVNGEESKRTFALLTPVIEYEGLYVISVIDRDYLIGGLFDISDTIIDMIIVRIGGDTYPAEKEFSSEYIHDVAISKQYGFNLLLQAKPNFVYILMLFSLLASIVLSLILTIIYYLALKVLHQRNDLTSDFLKGLKNGEFYMLYQPIVDTSSGEIKTVEALIRWNHPSSKGISPDIFIPFAEDAGMINDLTDYVLNKTLDDFLYENKYFGISLGINIPPNYLDDEKNVARLQYYIREFAKLGVNLTAEITERQIIDNNSMKAIKKLRSEGLKVAIDDFGTGHTSLSVIQEFQFDYLKIDKCFTDTIGLDTVNSPVLITIIDLGHRLNVLIVAEGVETVEQAKFLANNHVQRMQGYYFSQPVELKKLDFTKKYNMI